MLNLSAAIEHLNTHANQSSTGYCARYVRDALVAGGLNLPHMHAEQFANSLGGLLTSRGFREIYNASNASEHPQRGDVAVLQPYLAPKAHGHVAMFNGTKWVSDFVQQNGLYPNANYKKYHSEVRLFRPVAILGVTR
jgi:hypothetical protein